MYNKTRVAREAPRILGMGRPSARLSHPTFDNGGPENFWRFKSILRFDLRPVGEPRLQFGISANRQARRAEGTVYTK